MENREHVTLVKLFSGDMVLGTIEEKKQDGTMPAIAEFNINLNNPRVVAIMPTMSGSIKIALGSVSEPFNIKRLKEFISIPKSQVMFKLDEDEIDSELVNGYKSEISGIKIASASDEAIFNSIAQKHQ